MTTFKVASVKGETTPIQTKELSTTAVAAIAKTSKLKVEAGEGNSDSLLSFMEDRNGEVQPRNGLLLAVHTAFATHYPLILSPDDIWLAIAQGFGYHVEANAEKLRQSFFTGTKEGDKKIYIEIRRDGFFKGSPDNDWMGGFSEFSDKLAGYIGNKRNLLVSDFSTTCPVAKATSELVLMNAMKSYVNYGCRTQCGIPEITLLGTVADWESVKIRASNLAEFECKEWIDALIPVLDQFVAAAKGSPDKTFWNSFYKEGGGSGGPYITGAINTLFPYLKQQDWNSKVVTYELNTCMSRWKKGVGSMMGGPNLNHFPDGLSSVPFKWIYFEQTFDMAFLGGLVGAAQDPDSLAIKPVIGWGVADAK